MRDESEEALSWLNAASYSSLIPHPFIPSHLYSPSAHHSSAKKVGLCLAQKFGAHGEQF
jgi:hypothetical protein